MGEKVFLPKSCHEGYLWNQHHLVSRKIFFCQKMVQGPLVLVPGSDPKIYGAHILRIFSSGSEHISPPEYPFI